MSWRERAIVLVMVLGLLITGVTLGLLFSPEKTKQLFLLVPSSFFALGKFLPLIALRPECAFGPYELGVVIGLMDTATALIIVYSIHALYRFPRSARLFRKANYNAALVLSAYPWMRRFAIFSIILFVLFPVSGTGAIGGSFIGALLGLNRFRLMAAVSAGGFAGGTLMAFLSIRFGEAVRGLAHNPILVGALFTLLAAGLYGCHRAYRAALLRASHDVDETSPEFDP